MIQGLWDRQVYAIIDVKLGNGDGDADSYKYKPMSALLSKWKTIKNYKQGKQRHNQHNCFSPFFLSVNGMLGREALVVLSQLSRVMAEKREEPLLQVRGWVNGQIEITVTRSYSRMIHGAQLPSNL